MRVHDVARPETPNDPRAHHCVPLNPGDVSFKSRQVWELRECLGPCRRISGSRTVFVQAEAGVLARNLSCPLSLVLCVMNQTRGESHTPRFFHFIQAMSHYTAPEALIAHQSPSVMNGEGSRGQLSTRRHVIL